MGESDYIKLLDGVHQLVKAPIILVWDRLNTHVSCAMRRGAERRIRGGDPARVRIRVAPHTR
ncbi:hypothetical protein [Streptomyces kaempferi]|uniref:hypothetical protein n=1 Tax=Streptomyces kaempferi TaxID=333725 RepID=UPI003AA87E39